MAAFSLPFRPRPFSAVPCQPSFFPFFLVLLRFFSFLFLLFHLEAGLSPNERGAPVVIGFRLLNADWRLGEGQLGRDWMWDTRLGARADHTKIGGVFCKGVPQERSCPRPIQSPARTASRPARLEAALASPQRAPAACSAAAGCLTSRLSPICSNFQCVLKMK